MSRKWDYTSEEIIWGQFKSGDTSAFEWIFDHYFPQLFSYAHTISNDTELNEEEIQDLFVHLWEKREKLGNTDSIKLYLFKAIRRKLIKAINRQKSLSFTDYTNNKSLKIDSYETDLIKSEAISLKKQSISREIDNLSQRQREAIYLKYYQNKSNQEIAEILSITIESTYKLVHYALKSLKFNLEKISLLLFLFLDML